MVDELQKQDTPQSEDNTLSIIERAEKANKQLEDNLRKLQEETKRQEEILAKKLLGGRSYAGEITPIIDPELERKNRINKILEGTGLKI